jgi:hypothetical protein
MVADAYDAVTGVPGVHSAEVILEDHFASDVINAGVAAQAGFVQSFDGEAVAELGDLRARFLRKAVMAGTDMVCRPLVAAGTTPAELLALTLGCWSTRRQGSRSPRRRYRCTCARPASPARASRLIHPFAPECSECVIRTAGRPSRESTRSHRWWIAGHTRMWPAIHHHTEGKPSQHSSEIGRTREGSTYP